MSLKEKIFRRLTKSTWADGVINMKKVYAVVIVLFLSTQFSIAQEQTFDDLKPLDLLIGEWKGQLEYLNYSDNKTRVQLPTNLSCKKTELGEALTLNYVFQDPGYKIENIQLLTLNKMGQLVLTIVDGGIAKSSVLYVKSNETNNGLTSSMVFFESGYDNNQPALIRYTINLSASTLISLKEVKYDEGEFTFRNQIKLNKVNN
jgi:hypothetical protein